MIWLFILNGTFYLIDRTYIGHRSVAIDIEDYTVACWQDPHQVPLRESLVHRKGIQTYQGVNMGKKLPSERGRGTFTTYHQGEAIR